MDTHKSQQNNLEYTDFLLNLNEPMNIYLLGFIWADGHLPKQGYRTGLEIKKEDFFFDDYLIKYNIKTKERQHMRDGKLWGKPTKGFFTNNKLIRNFLVENDYVIKSRTEPTKILLKIPKDLRYLFFRGFFDGDGCLYVGARNSLAFWGSIEQNWTFLINIMDELDINFSIIKYNYEKHYSSCVECRKLKDIFKFFQYIYPEEIHNFGLQRKFNKFLIAKNRMLHMKISSSKIRGVTFNKRINKWGAFGEVKNKKTKTRDFLGWFSEEKDAIKTIRAYKDSNNL